MKPIVTFAMEAVRSENSPLVQLAERIADRVSPGTAHVIGAASGATGIALWAEVAKHLTVIMGLAVALMAFLGGAFYAGYWAIKLLREWRELRKTS